MDTPTLAILVGFFGGLVGVAMLMFGGWTGFKQHVSWAIYARDAKARFKLWTWFVLACVLGVVAFEAAQYGLLD